MATVQKSLVPLMMASRYSSIRLLTRRSSSSLGLGNFSSKHIHLGIDQGYAVLGN